MTKQEEILDFIRRRWRKDANWTDGNCLWFALILHKRFPYSRIYYMPIRGHFITKIAGIFYDATGIIIPDEIVQSLAELKRTDSLLYNRLIRDCFM